MEKRERLKQLIKERALSFGEVTLSSGKPSNYYLDAKMVTMDPEGAYLLAETLLEMLPEDVEAIGGPTLGADPIVGAVAALSYLKGKPIAAFLVRKEAKSHGKLKLIEGPFPAKSGTKVAIVEDVVTTGNSVLQAIRAAEDAGAKVVAVMALVDRLEGAREEFEARGYRFIPIFDALDLGLTSIDRG